MDRRRAPPREDEVARLQQRVEVLEAMVIPPAPVNYPSIEGLALHQQ